MAAAAALSAQSQPVDAPPPAAGAIDAPPSGWGVVHCGLARGVLWLTYIADGKAGITPAFDTPAIRAACAAAGHALGAVPHGDGRTADGRSPRRPQPAIAAAVDPPTPATGAPADSAALVPRRAAPVQPPMATPPVAMAASDGARLEITPRALGTVPSFAVRVLGPRLTVDARNDSDIAWRCQIDVAWAPDGDPAAPSQSTSAQSTRMRPANSSCAAPDHR